MVTILLEKDVEDIREKAKSKEELYWAETLERAMRSLMFAARSLVKQAEQGRLEQALFQFSHQISLATDTVNVQRALDKLRSQIGTGPVVSKVMSRNTRNIFEVKGQLDEECLALTHEIQDGVMESRRLRKLHPWVVESQVENSLLDNSGTIGLELIANVTAIGLLALATGHACRFDPKSKGLKPILKTFRERLESDINDLAELLGLGGETVLKIEANELIDDPKGNEPISEEKALELLNKYSKS